MEWLIILGGEGLANFAVVHLPCQNARENDLFAEASELHQLLVPLASIGHHHRRAGHEPPQGRAGAEAIRDVLAGIRRTHGVRPMRKQAADADTMRDIPRAITVDMPRAVRDRALLAISMAAALRRSVLVALTLDDVALAPEGLRLTTRRSKTGQQGEGAEIAIPEGRR